MASCRTIQIPPLIIQSYPNSFDEYNSFDERYIKMRYIEELFCLIFGFTPDGSWVFQRHANIYLIQREDRNTGELYHDVVVNFVPLFETPEIMTFTDKINAGLEVNIKSGDSWFWKIRKDLGPMPSSPTPLVEDEIPGPHLPGIHTYWDTDWDALGCPRPDLSHDEKEFRRFQKKILSEKPKMWWNDISEDYINTNSAAAAEPEATDEN